MDRGIGLGIDETGTGKIEYYKVHENALDHLLGGIGLDMGAPKVRNFGRGTIAVSTVTPSVEDRPEIRKDLIAALTKAGFEVGPM